MKPIETENEAWNNASMMNMIDPQLIAWLATACVGGSYVFQIMKAYQSKHLEDVSWLFLCVISLGNMLWIYYGYLRHDMTFFIANIVIASLVLLLIAMKFSFQFFGRF